mmetsp:Transcript_76355/g.210813  ORF Transcript_76355/g.210813 Transcript_76355/m.210813 type:complete len:204 (-) Transcript_76355:4023-4634(-)
MDEEDKVDSPMPPSAPVAGSTCTESVPLPGPKSNSPAKPARHVSLSKVTVPKRSPWRRKSLSYTSKHSSRSRCRSTSSGPWSHCGFVSFHITLVWNFSWPFTLHMTYGSLLPKPKRSAFRKFLAFSTETLSFTGGNSDPGRTGTTFTWMLPFPLPRRKDPSKPAKHWSRVSVAVPSEVLPVMSLSLTSNFNSSSVANVSSSGP